ncbi:hypothetical protein D083_3548 [Dickeya solani RNS 08.23.3.1.A]|nr:hypothetical protein D083_3548 [Dickeya solani RNS 08.23.3.1.A]
MDCVFLACGRAGFPAGVGPKTSAMLPFPDLRGKNSLR